LISPKPARVGTDTGSDLKTFPEPRSIPKTDSVSGLFRYGSSQIGPAPILSREGTIDESIKRGNMYRKDSVENKGTAEQNYGRYSKQEQRLRREAARVSFILYHRRAQKFRGLDADAKNERKGERGEHLPLIFGGRRKKQTKSPTCFATRLLT